MYYRSRQLAKLLRLSEEQIAGPIHANRLGAINVGGGAVRPRYRISQAHNSMRSWCCATSSAQPARRKRHEAVTEYF